MLKERRGALSLRSAASEAGVSFTTFSRVESGSQPDLASFTSLCGWLGVSPAMFFLESANRKEDPVDVAVIHLNADPRLTQDNAARIADALRAMYDALAAPPISAGGLAIHLRAATTLRPGVPQRLCHVLESLDSELRRRVAAGEI
jgi:transcriptional regulator with XRE-family HTH domain